MSGPCISRSPKKRIAAATQPDYILRPLSPYERNRANEVLLRDQFPMHFVTDEIRLTVLVKLGLRKG
jgi:hypothetical protein